MVCVKPVFAQALTQTRWSLQNRPPTKILFHKMRKEERKKETKKITPDIRGKPKREKPRPEQELREDITMKDLVQYNTTPTSSTHPHYNLESSPHSLYSQEKFGDSPSPSPLYAFKRKR